MCFAVSNRCGLRHHIYFEGGMTSERFVRFLEDLSAAVGDARTTFIFDNARPHARGLKDAEENGPNLASILSDAKLGRTRDQCFQSRLEEDVGRKSASSSAASPWREDAEFAQQSEMAIRVITVDKCANWFGKSQTYLAPAMAMEDIIM